MASTAQQGAPAVAWSVRLRCGSRGQSVQPRPLQAESCGRCRRRDLMNWKKVGARVDPASPAMLDQSIQTWRVAEHAHAVFRQLVPDAREFTARLLSAALDSSIPAVAGCRPDAATRCLAGRASGDLAGCRRNGIRRPALAQRLPTRNSARLRWRWRLAGANCFRAPWKIPSRTCTWFIADLAPLNCSNGCVLGAWLKELGAGISPQAGHHLRRQTLSV